MYPVENLHTSSQSNKKPSHTHTQNEERQLTEQEVPVELLYNLSGNQGNVC